MRFESEMFTHATYEVSDMNRQQKRQHLRPSSHRPWEFLTVFPLVRLDDVQLRVRPHEDEDGSDRYTHYESENEVCSGRVWVHKVRRDSGRRPQSSNRLTLIELSIHGYSRKAGYRLREVGGIGQKKRVAIIL